MEQITHQTKLDLSVVFYTPRDHLLDYSIPLWMRWFNYLCCVFICAWTQEPYCHVQVFWGGVTVSYSPFKRYTTVERQFYDHRPFTIAYHCVTYPWFYEYGISHSRRPTRVLDNFNNHPAPENCVSVADRILHLHFTKFKDDTIEKLINRRSTTLLQAKLCSGIYGQWRRETYVQDSERST